MEKISVVIITFNEEKNLRRCIESVKPVADEIIVLDSYSTDSTVKIARKTGARVFQQPFKGYKEQKNAAIKLAAHNYILSLDADEALSVELVHSILTVKDKFNCQTYTMNRCNFYCGRFIQHGLWYPDKKIRLFDKRVSYWGGINPHDKIMLGNNAGICHLQGDIFHYGYYSVEEHSRRNDELSTIAAESLYHAGINNSMLKLVFSPVWRFVKGYFLKLGFLDGYYGFVIAKQTARQAFLKYKKLNRLYKEQKKTNRPTSLVTQFPVSFSDK